MLSIAITPQGTVVGEPSVLASLTADVVSVLWLTVGGAFGGFLRGIVESRNLLGFWKRNEDGDLELGLVSDVLLGIGGALAILLVVKTVGIQESLLSSGR